MIKAIKKLFDWTPSDVAAWEKFRQPGWWHFVWSYGVLFFGTFLLIITGALTLINWLRAQAGLDSLFFQLAVDAAVCLVSGWITGLLTWWLEDSIYWKIIKSRPS